MKRRIVVCSKCGSLYDIHYIDNVKIDKYGNIIEFECKHCGMRPIIYKNLKDFTQDEK